MRYIFILTCLVPSWCFAFFCPTNFNQIEFGATKEQVMQQCGKPDKTETTTVTPEGPQEWNYYIPQTVATMGTTPMQGTLKTQVTFDANGNAVNISVNGIGVGATTICGSNLQLGDTRDMVKAACGTPSFINKQNSDSTALGMPPQKKEVTTFTYATNPPSTLIFENGVLTARQ